MHLLARTKPDENAYLTQLPGAFSAGYKIDVNFATSDELFNALSTNIDTDTYVNVAPFPKLVFSICAVI